MKNKLLFILLFFVSNIFAQSDVYYFKDTTNNLTLETVKNKEFILVKKRVLEKYTNSTIWFKIPADSTTKLRYVFRINSIRANNAIAYNYNRELKKLGFQRYSSFKFSRKHPTYVKLKSNLSPHFPIELKTVEESFYKENFKYLINGFYYGIAFLVILFSINYFYFFKDKAFLYYAFLLMSLTFSFVITDGMLTYFNVDDKIIETLILFDYIFLAFCSSKFSNKFLLVDNYFPKVKRYAYVLGLGIILFVILYLIFRSNELYIILNILVFTILFMYYFISILLFKKSVHNKIFTIGYVILLFSGLDFFVFKNFGISLFESNSSTIKVGGFVQIIALSFAVLFREKSLRKYNFFMKNEIIKFSKEIEELTNEKNLEPKKESIENLSLREREVFNLIVVGKSNKQIASEVNISVNTVKYHVKKIYGKLNIKNRKEVLIIKNSLKH